jgi:DNA-binding transcriptional LysR family regulator
MIKMKEVKERDVFTVMTKPLDLDQLITFRAVAQNLNFTTAGKGLGMAQSSVTAHIQALERHVGVMLFDRLGKKVALTNAGHILLGYAEQILILEANARLSLLNNMAERICIGAPETLLAYRLPQVLRKFRQTEPNVKIVFKPGISAHLRDDVREGRLDFAFTLDAISQHPMLKSEVLRKEPVLLIAPPDHPLVSQNTVIAADLSNETFLMTEAGGSYRMAFEHMLSEAGVVPADVLEFSSIEAEIQCVMAGLGIAILPEVTVREDLRQKRVAALAWAGASLQVFAQMIWHKDKQLSSSLVKLCNVARQVIMA